MSFGISATHRAVWRASAARRRFVAALCTGGLAVGVVIASPQNAAAVATPAASLAPATAAAPSAHPAATGPLGRPSATGPWGRGGARSAPIAPAVIKQQRAAGTDRSTYYVQLTGTSVGTTFQQNRSRGTAFAKQAATNSAKAIASHVATVFPRRSNLIRTPPCCTARRT